MQDKISEIKFFNEWAEKYGYYEVHPKHEYQRVLLETGILKEDPHQLVLDAGCGSGAFSTILSEYGFNVIGVDIASKLISATHRRQKNSVLDTNYVVADIEKLPFRPSSFNCIFCGAILHHLPTRIEQVVCEFYKVLSLGGKVYLCEPNALNLGNFLIYHFSNKTGRTRSERALNPSKLKQNFEGNGFSAFRYTNIGNVQSQTQTDVVDIKKSSIARRLFRKTVGIFVRYASSIPLMPSNFFVASCVKTAPTVLGEMG